MSMKDVSDKEVCKAIMDCRNEMGDVKQWPYEILAARTGQPEKVCYRAMERAHDRGFICYGVSLRTAWLTDKGKELLNGTTNTTTLST